MKNTLPKKERLKSIKAIEQLFARNDTENQSFLAYPIKIIARQNEQDTHTPLPQVLFSVSKRNFKRAVDRNLLKRRLREAYRTNKVILEETTNFKNIAFMYVAKEEISFQDIEKSMQKALKKCNSLKKSTT